MYKFPLIILLSCFLSVNLISQEITYGFKAGLNFNRIIGPSEFDDASAEVEQFNMGTGFHVGAAFNYKFYDRFGVRAELMYSQKGGEYKYDGQSYRIFTDRNFDQKITVGTMQTTLKIANSYIDIPVMFYARMVPWLELSAGVNVGFMIGSTAQGELVYNSVNPNGTPLDQVRFLLDYRYFKDEAGEVVDPNGAILQIGNDFVDLPNTIGAYYDYDLKDGSFYNVLDFGLNAGAHFFINKGLFIGARLNYGLLDITNETYESSQVKLDPAGNRISRSDKDTNFSIQTSVGFSF